SDPQAWLTRGVIRAQEKDYARALADFDQAIKLAPRLAEAWHNRAVTLMWMDKLPEAEADFARFSEFGGKLKPEAEQLWREGKERLKQKKGVSQELKVDNSSREITEQTEQTEQTETAEPLPFVPSFPFVP